VAKASHDKPSLSLQGWLGEQGVVAVDRIRALWIWGSVHLKTSGSQDAPRNFSSGMKYDAAVLTAVPLRGG